MKLVPEVKKQHIRNETQLYKNHRENCCKCILAFDPSELCPNGYEHWLRTKRLIGKLNGVYDDGTSYDILLGPLENKLWKDRDRGK